MSLTIELTDIGGTAEVAALLECPKQQIHALRKNPSFPTPVRTLSSTPIWRLSEVDTFKTTWKRRKKSDQPTAEETV